MAINMNRLGFGFIFVVFAFASSVSCTNCDVSNASKVDCGYSGITQGECESKGCCWQPEGHDSLIPWCFYSASHHTQCDLIYNSTGTPPFTTDEFNTMLGYMLKNVNIDGKGGIVASPDKNVPEGGSYYYHWERDAAISIRALLKISQLKNTAIDSDIQAYVQWVLHVQNEVDPHGIDVLTEPKYLLPDGQVYPGGWCRPQTDGPGLRSLALMDYADALMKNGKKSYVQQYLWTGAQDKYNGGAIKYDLDWVAANWTTSGCDLWENVRSTDFFWNRYTFKHALLRGATFASQMGDTTSASKYQSAAQSIASTLLAHWDAELEYVYESTNRPVDAAVIVAFNEGYSQDTTFSPTSKYVLGTIRYLNTFFCESFPINVQDTSNGINGILYGRFKGDNYPDAGGNPWVLTTAALGELLYRGAAHTIEHGLPSPQAIRVWEHVLGRHTATSADTKRADTKRADITSADITSAAAAEKRQHVSSSYDVFEFARSLAQAGDGVMERLKYHVKNDQFHLYEQISKTNGKQMSAYDLTWSYGTTLKAIAFRDTYVDTVMRLRSPEEYAGDSFFKKIITA